VGAGAEFPDKKEGAFRNDGFRARKGLVLVPIPPTQSCEIPVVEEEVSAALALALAVEAVAAIAAVDRFRVRAKCKDATKRCSGFVVVTLTL
jgi:hypothetical protein